MNMQNIQILFLLIDSAIKLAPWRIVTETMQRIGYDASESLVPRHSDYDSLEVTG